MSTTQAKCKNRVGKVVWFTGLSGAGKSTLSLLLKGALESRGVPVIVLDGDLLRTGLNRDLGFSAMDRAENIRRAGETAKILADAGHTVICAFITPLESLRRAVRGIFPPSRFVEVFLDCPLSVCMDRDAKGLYRRAQSGEIPDFTGISAPFETPEASDLTVSTADTTPHACVAKILDCLESRFDDLCPAGPLTARGAKRDRRVVVIGLDCVPPSLVFGDAGKELSILRCLMDNGVWGPLRSTDPPITIPAWTTITTGRDPGELGLYGFRNRLDHSYDRLASADDTYVDVPRVWEYLEAAGKTSILIGIPQTYPPRPHRGITVAGFPAPDTAEAYTYPPHMAAELAASDRGGYMIDVKGFRTLDKDRLLDALTTMARRRFEVAADLMVHRPWDFFMLVEIATDRLHHGFWRYASPTHRLFEPGNPYEHVVRDFYRYVDAQLGALLALLHDDTTVIVVSDHGVRDMVGGVAINEWLIRNGLLVLRHPPEGEEPLAPEMVDWSRTTVWSEGGYYARIFLNVKGREPHGVIEPSRYRTFREDLAGRLAAMTDGDGRDLGNEVLVPEQIYRSCRGVPPDLIVYFGGLSRRSLGTVGTGEIFRSGNDTGPDDANHDKHGIFIAATMADVRSGRQIGRQIERAGCLDITPTILDQFGLQVPPDLGGRVLQIGSGPCSIPVERAPVGSDAGGAQQAPREVEVKGFTPEEEEEVKRRLMELGYL